MIQGLAVFSLRHVSVARGFTVHFPFALERVSEFASCLPLSLNLFSPFRTQTDRAAMAATNLNEIFRAVPLSALPPPPKGVLTLRSDMTVPAAVQFLTEHNILSAPVIDASQPADAPWQVTAKTKKKGRKKANKQCLKS